MTDLPETPVGSSSSTFQLPPAPPVGPLQFYDPFQNNYAPAPAPASIYQHLPAHLALDIAQLPPLQSIGGKHRGPQRQLPVISAPLVRILIDQYQYIYLFICSHPDRLILF